MDASTVSRAWAASPVQMTAALQSETIDAVKMASVMAVCTENLIRVDDVIESPKLAP
jgi:hypothetical protein